MNALVQVPQNFGAVSSRFAGQPVVDDLGSGIASGFGHIGYKGKAWSIRYRGQEKILMRDDNDGQRNNIEVIIVKASGAVSKIFYENGYTEGSNAAPDCFSSNGVTPDASSRSKQNQTCAGCPMNAWITKPDGKKGKRCNDSKRLAVVPLGDITNETFGGPMLLRVPAASLSDLKAYGDTMRQAGYPYYAVGTRIAFDPKEAYPKFVFNGIRALSDAEADLVVQMQNSPEVARILAEVQETPAAPAPASVFEQPPQPAPMSAPSQTPKSAPAPAPVANPAPVRAVAGSFGAAAPAPQAEQSATGVANFDDQLDQLLA